MLLPQGTDCSCFFLCLVEGYIIIWPSMSCRSLQIEFSEVGLVATDSPRVLNKTKRMQM